LDLMTKKRRIALVVLVAILALVVAGCGVPRGDIDPDAPAEGPWQQYIVYPLAWALEQLDGLIGGAHSFGWAIILFTVLVKLVTLPLSFSQMRSTRKMQALQPQLQELQKKYAKDRETLSQKQLELYREAGVNPMGGCLPMIIQYPVLIGMYSSLYLLARQQKLTGKSFYWIPDLAFPNEGMSWLTEAWQGQDWRTLAIYVSLPLVLVATQIVLQKLTSRSQPTSGDQQQGMMNNMFLVMSVMFGYITLQTPSGLALYWVTSNLLGLLQQYLMVTRFMPATPPLVTLPSESQPEEIDEEMLAIEAAVEELVLIKGIGGKTAAVLAAAGIVSFTDLAASDEEELTEIIDEAGLPAGDYAWWIRQAAKLEREQS
jgi:YidC/Oxa1 family membrane protein insertase